MANGPYSRLYHQFPDEYPDIYEDDACLALWARLLVIGDQAWPSMGTLPYGTRRKPLGILVACELVHVEGRRFRILGMEKERQRRSEKARTAANIRHAPSRQ